MSEYKDLKGTSQSTFEIGKKTKLDTSSVTSKRNFKLPDLPVDMSGGATGDVLKQGASGFTMEPSDPMTTEGDIIIKNVENVTARLASGTNGQVLSIQQNTDVVNINIGTAFNGSVRAMALNSIGQIILVGAFTSFNGNTRNRIVRLNYDGTEDTAFYTNLGTAFNATTRNVYVLSNDEIIVSTGFTSFNGNTRPAIVKLNNNGTEDTTFATNIGGFLGAAKQVLQQADGKIIMIGNPITSGQYIIRTTVTGIEDTTFRTNQGTGFNLAPSCISLQSSDQKILVGGDFTSFNSNTRRSLVRLGTTGAEDTAFYANLGTGFAGTDPSVYGLAIQNDGAIVAAGAFTSLNGNTRYCLVRLASTGIEDGTFYTNLGTGFSVGSPTLWGTPHIQSDGKIVITGSFTSFNGNTRNYILRLNSTGIEDTSFYTNFGTGFNALTRGCLQSANQKFLIFGDFTSLNSITRNYLIKLNTDSTAEDYILMPSWNTSSADWNIVQLSGNTTAVKNTYYWVLTTGGAYTITLPASPALGDSFIVKDGSKADTNPITIALAGVGTEKINNKTLPRLLSKKWGTWKFTCIGNTASTYEWAMDYMGIPYASLAQNITPAMSPFNLTLGNAYTVNTGAGAITLNLPNPTSYGVDGSDFIILKDIGGGLNTNNVTLVRYGSETIDSTAANRILSASYGSWTIMLNGANWNLI